MLNKFIDWATQIASKPIGNDVVAQVTESEMSDNPSARLDIDTPTTVARITCWKSGDYDAEVIHIETERTLFSSHGNLQQGLEFSDQFADFFKSLGITTD
ncbi:hypothetical protein [Chitinivorax sp. B]|uniref:immunity protein TriTu family protein n=1 Tax=Chitinivorax sp. B TaxID=2502235 RepID=UPI0010F5B07C|nr:hypothetical protein [Chitinivorax sp. B]